MEGPNSTGNLLRQCLHLLEGLPEQKDPEISREILSIKGEIRVALSMVKERNIVGADFALRNTISRRIDELIRQL